MRQTNMNNNNTRTKNKKTKALNTEYRWVYGNYNMNNRSISRAVSYGNDCVM